MWKWRVAILLTVLVTFVAIIIWDSGWANRETSAAFSARFQTVPRLSFDQQFHRGVICGSYQFRLQMPGRFLFVSHYSSGDNPEGLLIQSDAPFQAAAYKLCPKR
jgi:hypothetical protein